MKQTFAFLFYFIVAATVFAQEADETVQTEKASSAADRVVIELAHLNWLNKPIEELETKWYSRAVNLYFTYDFPISKNKNVSFSPGLGVGTNVINVNHFFDPNAADSVVFTAIPDSVTFTRNNLHTPYLDVPLEMRFRTNPDRFGRRWKFAVGFKGGYSFQAHTKYIGTNPSAVSNPEIKVKEFRLTNLNNFRYGYTARFGYGSINLIAFFSQSTLFKRDSGPGIYPFNIGISFNSL